MENKAKIIGGTKILANQTLEIKVECKSSKKANTPKTNTSEQEKNKSEEKDEYGTSNVSIWNFMYCPLILVSCICFVSTVILVPQHDGVLYPDYWYELMININLTYCLGWTVTFIHDVKVILNMSSMVSKWSYAKMYVVLVLSSDIIYCICFFTWTYGLRYKYPVPFLNSSMYIVAGI